MPTFVPNNKGPAGGGSVPVGVITGSKATGGAQPVGIVGGSQPSTGAVKAPAKKGGGGFLGGVTGFAKNLGSDIAGEAVGFGPGVYHLGKHAAQDVTGFAQNVPKELGTLGSHRPEHLKQTGRVAKDVRTLGKQYGQTYGPLAHGDVGKFAKGVYKHPLGPFLDALTLATAGAGAGVKAGLVSGERATTEIASPALRAGEAAGPVKKAITSEKPLVRSRQIATNKALNKIQFSRGKVTVDVESGRYGKAIHRDALQSAYEEHPHFRQYAKDTQHLSNDEWKALNIRARDVHPADLSEFWKGTPNGKILAEPKVAKLVLHPTDRLLKAEQASRLISAHGERVLRSLGYLKEETAAAKPAKFRTQVATALGREPRSIHGNPYYVPDVAEPVKGGSPYQAMGGGKGVPQTPGTAKMNKGILAGLGKFDVKHDILGPEFVRRVKVKTHSIIHDSLLEASVKRTPAQLKAEGIPIGWDLIRKPVVSKTGSVRPQEVPFTHRLPGESGALPKDLLPDPNNLRESPLTEGFGAKGDTNAAHQDSKGNYYIAPKTMIRHAAGEFHRSSTAVHYLIEKPLSTWRYLILGTRLGFLTNNVIGNHVMLAVKTAGVDGIRSYLHALYNAKGPEAVRRLLNLPMTPKGLSKQMMDEFFPEQVEGTFGRTQGPTAGLTTSSKLARRTKSFGTGIFPATQAAAEQLPRRAAAEYFVRRSPEFKKVYASLPKQTSSFETAFHKVMSGEGGKLYQRRISDQVNETLGNYLNLSQAERSVIRNILPFYSWYRAITTTTFHLAEDTPGRALALQKIGQIGQDDAEKLLGPLPSYLKGAIPFGKPSGGEATVLSTAGMNPYATLQQVGSGATSDISNLGLNPFLMAGLQSYGTAANKQHTPFPRVAPGAFVHDIGSQIGQGLPPYRLIRPPKGSKLYPHRNRLSEMLAQAGAPVKRVNLQQAHYYASQGR